MCINSEVFPKEAIVYDVPGLYCQYREVSHEYVVPTGNYCVIPTTYTPGEEAEYLLRVLTPQVAELW